MAITDINNAAAAMNALSARATGFFDNLDADIDVRRDAYDDLVGDIRNAAAGVLGFEATVDPDIDNPSEIDGGTFNTIGAALAASPASSHVRLVLAAGKDYPLTENFNMAGRNVQIVYVGNAARPVIKPQAFITAGNKNRVFGFQFRGAEFMRIDGCDIVMPQKAQANLDWDVAVALFFRSPGAQLAMSINSSLITGASPLAITTCAGGGQVNLAVNSVTISGSMSAVSSVQSGVAIISTQNLTMENGAAVTDGGTIGVNILKN